MADYFVHPTAEAHVNAQIGAGTKIWNYAQIRENAVLGEQCVIGKNVYVDFGVHIGNRVKIQNNVSVFHGVTIEDGVFVGPHVCFTNDLFPRAINPDGSLKGADDWTVSETVIKYGASIGANATIVAGITVGSFALIGSGSVVTKDVPEQGLVVGSAARLIGYVCKCGLRLTYHSESENWNCAKCDISYPFPAIR